MTTFLTILALIFGLALIVTGGWLTFTRRPLARILFVVFGAFVTLLSLALSTSVRTDNGEPSQIQPIETVSTPRTD